MTSCNPDAPSSVLIIGSGVFGLSTAYALAQRPFYKHTAITILDFSPFPNPHGSSIDSSRIIRADYSSRTYARLAHSAQLLWRQAPWVSSNHYHESGLLLCADRSQSEYVRRSCANVRDLQRTLDGRSSIIELPTPAAIAAAAQTGGDASASATWGYLNPKSGWADAEGSMRVLHELVLATGRVRFIEGRATRLIFSPSRTKVLGARLADGRDLQAELVVLATGAWSPLLLDLRQQAIATAQSVAYLRLSHEEVDRLKRMPVILNLSTGCFVIPPHEGKRELKVARHAFGFANPASIPHPERDQVEGGETIRTSVPTTSYARLPGEDELILRAALASMVPWLAERPFCATRLCWYTDTPTGDFLVGRHPKYEGLCLATGGSGHAFKFLPVLGEKVVDALEGRLEQDLAQLWAWKDYDGQVVQGTEDGSRAGTPGKVLMQETGKLASRL